MESKSLILALLLSGVLFGSMIFQTEAADPKLDRALAEKAFFLVEGRLPEDELVTLQENPDTEFVKKEYARLKPEHDRRLKETIRTEPGITSYLFAMLDRAYREYPSGRVGAILDAIALREDLKPEEIETVRREVAKILTEGLTNDPGIAGVRNNYVTSGIAVVARDLTPADEDLLIIALQWDQSAVANGAAAIVLTKAGVTRAIPAMQTTLARLEAKHDLSIELITENLRVLTEKARKKATQKE